MPAKAKHVWQEKICQKKLDGDGNKSSSENMKGETRNDNNSTTESIRNFIYREIRPLTAQILEENMDDPDERHVENDLAQILNITRVPAELETLFAFSLLACLNCFLHYFSILPLRIIHGLVTRKNAFAKIRKEFISAALILGSCFILISVDTSRVYHKIKGQNGIKLYMIFQVLEMAEKMVSAIGLDLYSTVLSSKLNKSRKQMIGIYVASCVCQTIHSLILIYQTLAMNVAVNSYSNSLWTLLLSMQFAEIKAAVFKRIDKEGFFQLCIADIVERFYLVMFLLIISIRNFVAAGNTWSDILPNSWNFNSTHSLAISVLVGPTVTVIGSELIVDWIKHAYVIKFNRIRPKIYQRFSQILCNDHSTSILSFQQRLGLSMPTLVVTFVVLVFPSLKRAFNGNPLYCLVCLILGFIWSTLLKLSIKLLLLRWTRIIQSEAVNMHPDVIYARGTLSVGRGQMNDEARKAIHGVPKGSKKQNQGIEVLTPSQSPTSLPLDKIPALPLSMEEQRAKRDIKHPRSLESVERFRMVSKRIW